jgi:hypothetical protein
MCSPSADQTFAEVVLSHCIILTKAVETVALLSQKFRLIALHPLDIPSFNKIRSRIEKGFTFDHVLSTHGRGPTALDTVGQCCEYLRADKDHILVIGQSLFHHLTPAAALGFPAAWVRREDSVLGCSKAEVYSDARPAWVVDSLEGLLAIFPDAHPT